MRISNLRSFFERIIEWGYPDAPKRNPVFAGDMPIKDPPLPRFLAYPHPPPLPAAAPKRPPALHRVAAEALAAGVPVVASAVGGLRELAPHALLGPPEDPRALATAIDQAIAVPPPRAMLASFDWQTVTARLLRHARA